MVNWYLQSGKNSDVVMSSRIRLARNLADFPFVAKCKENQLIEIQNRIKEITPNIGYGLKYVELKDMDDITKMALVEKHIVSPDFALKEEKTGAILINEEENIAIMINEEDHLRLQVFGAGLELDNLMNLAIEIDEKLQGLLNYSCHEKYGFLTQCPSNVGTGLRASVMLHLPALTSTGNIQKILDIISNFGMDIRGIYGEGSQVQGNMYQISNKQSLGISESEIVKNLKVITEKIMEQEKLARKYLLKNEVELTDRIYRSFGVLVYSKKISSEEAKQLISDVRLGTDLGLLKEIDDLKVNKLELYTRPANLQKYFGQQLNAYERDIKRAEAIKQIVKE